MKGIILAGGTGSRLWPITKGTSKQLLPIYDKPMIYYPLSTLLSAGIREIAVISTRAFLDQFRNLLGDGNNFGVSITYLVQDEPLGIAQALILSEEFLQGGSCCLILGDNIFHGPGLESSLTEGLGSSGARIFAYRVSNPQDYGVVTVDEVGRPTSVIEKPLEYIGNLAIPGIYFFDSSAPLRASNLQFSARGELEITDLIQSYLNEGSLELSILPRGTVWLDAGSFESLAEATEYVRVIQKREGMQIGCPEEISWRLGLITDDQTRELGKQLSKSSYGEYLLDLVGREN
jgi:glucose-1-phosphate thymidylyltransferase